MNPIAKYYERFENQLNGVSLNLSSNEHKPTNIYTVLATFKQLRPCDTNCYMLYCGGFVCGKGLCRAFFDFTTQPSPLMFFSSLRLFVNCLVTKMVFNKWNLCHLIPICSLVQLKDLKFQFKTLLKLWIEYGNKYNVIRFIIQI